VKRREVRNRMGFKMKVLHEGEREDCVNQQEFEGQRKHRTLEETEVPYDDFEIERNSKIFAIKREIGGS
jgi:hypothetical protein